MHELAVCQSLIRETEKVAEKHGARRVTRLVVAIGPLSGVEAPLLERAFEIARFGTVADGAVLEIETMPVTVWCGDCEAESVVPANALLCDRCGTWKVSVRSGDELLLKRLELAPDEAPADMAV
ncbi:MAG: hydrogenase maturation nickel metallochaperone HypA [Rhodobiaceae bacterium]|nr:hydrogenase maturation nickel metallochaperone HypA [Rhodobiaceae bacterium]